MQHLQHVCIFGPARIQHLYKCLIITMKTKCRMLKVQPSCVQSQINWNEFQNINVCPFKAHFNATETNPPQISPHIPKLIHPRRGRCSHTESNRAGGTKIETQMKSDKKVTHIPQLDQTSCRIQMKWLGFDLPCNKSYMHQRKGSPGGITQQAKDRWPSSDWQRLCQVERLHKSDDTDSRKQYPTADVLALRLCQLLCHE